MSSTPSPERWTRMVDLFDAALDLPEQEREPFLQAECGEDAELLGEVLALLLQRAPEGFLEPPTVAPDD